MSEASAATRPNPLSPRRIGLALSVVLLVLMTQHTAPQHQLHTVLFDAYQRLGPRDRASAPAVVVAIDESSLSAIGQWPWPRTRLAELVERIAEFNPAAIGVDIIMPEPDRLSPERLLESLPALNKDVAGYIASLPNNDERLAQAMQGRRVVLGVAGEKSTRRASRPLPAAPIRWHGTGGPTYDPASKLEQFDVAVRSLPEFEAVAAGVGLLNNPDPAAPIVRRPMLFGRVGDVPVPALGVELLRVAEKFEWIDAYLVDGALKSVGLGELHIPSDADGRTWIHYGRYDANRYVPAKDIFEGRVAADELERKLVLLAVTGVGLLDQVATPVDDHKVPGIEIHLQLIENIFDRNWLQRPSWAIAVEAVLFAGLALALVGLMTSRRHRWALPVFIGLSAAGGLAGILAFDAGLLFDVATPVVAAALVWATMLAATLSEVRRQRRELARHLQVQREEAARLAGELDAARRVQMGMLPESPDVRAGDMRMEIKAYMEPARDVGGDLYDFFMLDEDTLFVLIGDVSGKGLPAAIFMALVKSLCKSAAMRGRSLARAMKDAESEIINENPELMFVTLTALTLNLNTGEVEYCNAGHEPPYAIGSGRRGHLRLADGGGPPLCVLPGFDYQSGSYRMAPREMLCLVTDGVVDATNPKGEMYGRERLEDALEGIASEDPATVVGTLKQVLQMFSGGTELADDQTALVLRWNGPGTSGLIGERP